MSTIKRGTVVMGLGNPIMGDDGLGLAVLDHLRTAYAFPPEVELVDGGTWGMNLLPVIEDAAQLILIDAIDAGVPPGTFVRLEHDRLPRYLATKISPHQVDLRDVLALAELRGTMPADTVALGLQPASIEMRHSLSKIVRSAVPELVEQVVQELARRGHAVEGFLVEPAHA